MWVGEARLGFGFLSFFFGGGVWSFGLGAKKIHEQKTAGPLFHERAPPPPAGFNMAFEDLVLNASAGAPQAASAFWGLF